MIYVYKTCGFYYKIIYDSNSLNCYKSQDIDMTQIYINLTTYTIRRR